MNNRILDSVNLQKHSCKEYNNYHLIKPSVTNNQSNMTKSSEKQNRQNKQARYKKQNMHCYAAFIINQQAFYAKTWLIVLMLVLVIVCPANASCEVIAEEEIYINSTDYCRMQFCSYTLALTCYKIKCLTEKAVQCTEQFLSTSDVTCDISCCLNIDAIENQDYYYSQQFCATYHTSSADTVATYSTVTIIIFSVFGAIFVIIVICICCKKFSRRREAQNSNEANNRGTMEVIAPSPEINLDDYKLDEEGPYLINIHNQCAICLDPNVNLRTHCNHFYHGICLFDWFKKNIGSPCPLCISKKTNPVKVYCKQCFAGDKLILFNGNMRRTQVVKIDSHMCELCKNGPKDDNLTFYDGSAYNSSNNGQKTISKKNQSLTLRKQGKNKQEKVIVEDQLQNSAKKMNTNQHQL